jgi:hypothetical protein
VNVHERLAIGPSPAPLRERLLPGDAAGKNVSALPRARGKSVVFEANMTVKRILAGWIEGRGMVRVAPRGWADGGWR